MSLHQRNLTWWFYIETSTKASASCPASSSVRPHWIFPIMNLFSSLYELMLQQFQHENCNITARQSIFLHSIKNGKALNYYTQPFMNSMMQSDWSPSRQGRKQLSWGLLLWIKKKKGLCEMKWQVLFIWRAVRKWEGIGAPSAKNLFITSVGNKNLSSVCLRNQTSDPEQAAE